MVKSFIFSSSSARERSRRRRVEAKKFFFLRLVIGIAKLSFSAMDLPLSPLPGRLRVWLFKDVENVKCVRERRERKCKEGKQGREERRATANASSRRDGDENSAR